MKTLSDALDNFKIARARAGRPPHIRAARLRPKRRETAEPSPRSRAYVEQPAGDAPVWRGTEILAGGTQAAGLVVQPGGESELDAIHALECASFATDRLSRRALRRFLTASHRPLLVATFRGPRRRLHR